MSLYPGPNFEKHVESIVAGGPLLGYVAQKALVSVGSQAAMPAPTNAEDRNRTAPFPWCGNRFEFRATGSSQNCSFPVAICNVIMSSGLAALSSKMEGGMSHRDAVAELLTASKHVIFTGNGYGADWPAEAAKRGLPNLVNTPAAIEAFNTPKAKAVFSTMKVLSEAECDARAEVMWENYVTCVTIECDTFINMVDTAIMPACAQDLAIYAAAPALAGRRLALYTSIKDENDKLKQMRKDMPAQIAEEAHFLADTIKPQMQVVRNLVDEAEGLMQKGLYPFPNYEELVYSHHV